MGGWGAGPVLEVLIGLCSVTVREVGWPWSQGVPFKPRLERWEVGVGQIQGKGKVFKVGKREERVWKKNDGAGEWWERASSPRRDGRGEQRLSRTGPCRPW